MKQCIFLHNLKVVTLKKFGCLIISIILLSAFAVVNHSAKAQEVESSLINRFSFNTYNDSYWQTNISFYSDQITINAFTETTDTRPVFKVEFNDSKFTRDSDTGEPYYYQYVSTDRISETYKPTAKSHLGRGNTSYYTYSIYITLRIKNSDSVNEKDYIIINNERCCCTGNVLQSSVNCYYAASSIVIQDPNSFGDINFDNKIDADDAQTVLQFYLTNLSNQNEGTLVDYVRSNGYQPSEEYLHLNKDAIDSKYAFKELLIDRANAYAEKLYEAAKHAVYDLAEEDANLSGLITGAGIDVGGSSAVTSAPAAGASSLVKFQYRVYVYFTDATKLTAAQVQLDSNYNVVGVGVMDKNNYCGTYPKQMTVDSYDNLATKTASAALAYATALQ